MASRLSQPEFFQKPYSSTPLPAATCFCCFKVQPGLIAQLVGNASHLGVCYLPSTSLHSLGRRRITTFLFVLLEENSLLRTVLVSLAVSCYIQARLVHSQWRTVFVFHKAVGKKNGGPKADPPTTLLQRATQPNARALELKSARADRVPRTLKLRSNPSASHRPEKAVGGARARTRWNDHRVARTGRAARSCPASGSAALLRELPRTQFPWGLNMAPRGETLEVCVSAHCPIGTCQSLHLSALQSLT